MGGASWLSGNAVWVEPNARQCFVDGARWFLPGNAFLGGDFTLYVKPVCLHHIVGIAIID